VATRLRVAAQGIAVEAGGAAGARGELQRCQAVVDQLQLLDEEFLQPLGVSQYRLAKAIDVPASRICAIAVFWD
jgi:hypothetical protein